MLVPANKQRCEIDIGIKKDEDKKQKQIKAAWIFNYAKVQRRLSP